MAELTLEDVIQDSVEAISAEVGGVTGTPIGEGTVDHYIEKESEEVGAGG